MVSDGGRRWRLVRAGTDAVPVYLRKLFFPRAAGKKPGRLPWALIGASVATIVFLGWLVFASPVLGVRQIRVDGVSFLDEEQVRQASGVTDGTPLTRVDTQQVAAKVATIAAVASVEVSRIWPATLRINVVEREAIGGIKRDNAFQLFDAGGVVFRSAGTLPAGVVQVEVNADKLIQACTVVLKALTQELRGQLARLVIDGPAGITLVLKKDRMVVWGDERQSELKAKVATALLKQKGNRIDVSVPEIVTIQ